MNFSEAPVGSFPEFGVTHGLEEVVDFILFVLTIGCNLQFVNLLQDLGLFVKKLLQCKLFLIFFQISRVLNLFGFI